jgi:hypothetical protein
MCWSVIEARDSNAAIRLMDDHPFIGRGGTLQLSEPVLVAQPRSCCYPRTRLVVLDVVWRLAERLPESVMAGVTEHQEVLHAPATLGFLLRRCLIQVSSRNGSCRAMTDDQTESAAAGNRTEIQHKMIMPSQTSFSRVLDRRRAAAKCSNRTGRHRLHATVIGLWPASTASIDRFAPRW